jgi:exopolyphosphatase / guanosine-5'-triphosphate,3'-diphosphate pyrophosphatase
MPAMRVSVIDVGSNTARLFVADVRRSGLTIVDEDRAFLELGANLPADTDKLTDLRKVARRFAKRSRELDVDIAESVVTAPGRGPRGEAIVQVLREVTKGPVRVLTPDDEGCLAYTGAVACAVDVPEVVAVVDVGGGSTEIVVGTPWFGPSWVRSLELGSLSLTRAYLQGDAPDTRALEAARDDVRRSLESVDPPWSDAALATGGSARAMRKIIGEAYTADELDDAISALSRVRATEVAEVFGINPRRAGTVVGGAVVLAEVARVLRRRLIVARGGLREGVALELAAEAARAAA